MKKRVYCIFVVLLIIFTCCGCSFKNSDKEVTTTTVSEEDENSSYTDINIISDGEQENQYYQPVDITTGYDSLENDEQKLFYKEITSSIEVVSEEKNDDGTYSCRLVSLDDTVLTQSEIRFVIAAVKMDNPLVFWLTENFGFSNTGGFTALQLYSYESPDNIKSMQKKQFKKINKFIMSLKEGLDEFSLELKAHDMIIDSCEYSAEVESSKDDYLAFTPYGAFVNGSAVCEGYAKAFQYLLSRVGIKSYTVMGRGSKELHMWDCVNIDNSWYYVDPSWDDGKKYSQYDYFNITTEQLKYDHTISNLYSEYTSDEICGTNGYDAVNFNLKLSQCDDNDANYYVKKSAHFTDLYSYYDDDIINSLYECANNGDKYFHIYIDPMYLEFNNAVEQLFNSGDQLFFSYIDYVNDMQPNYPINKDNISIVKKENLSVVTVKISG